MPDQRSVLKEYRALEQKRLAQGLTPVEDRRHAELKALVGPELGGARGGFDVNAAAARLRESLLPAGLRNRPPPTPTVVEPEQLAEPEPVFAEPEPAPEAAWAEQPPEAAPAAEDGLFDPALLGTEGEQTPPLAYDPAAAEPQAWDANAQAYDPNGQPYDPNAQPYDPNATWDQNAQPYDPNAQPYDPNAQPYDPNATWDPNAQPQAYDPNAPQAYDPNAPWDADAQAYDPNAQPYDPNAAPAEGAWDPAALAAEPAAVEAEPQPAELAGFEGEFTAAPEAEGAQGDWSLGATAPQDGAPNPAEPAPLELEDPYAGALPEPEPALAAEPATLPEGWEPGVEGAAPPPEGTPLGEYDETGPAAFAPPPEDGSLGFDAAAASAITPAQLPEGYEAVPGEYDDNGGFGVAGYETPPAAHLDDSAVHGAAPSWQPDDALDQGFQLASGGSFDASADARSPDWAGAAPEAARPWEGGELTEPEPEPDLGAPVELDRSQPDLSGGDEAADDFFAISAPPLALGGPSSLKPAPARAPPAGPPPGLRGVAAPAPASGKPVIAPLPPEPMPTLEEIPELEAEEILEPMDVEEPIEPALAPEPFAAAEPEPAPAPEPEPEPAVEVEALEAVEIEEIVHPDPGLEAPPDLDFPSGIAEPFPPSPPPAAYAAAEPASEEPAPEAAPLEAEVEAAPAAEPEPEPEAAPAATMPFPVEDVSMDEVAPPEASSVVPGSHRVVVHTLEGLVKRGVLTDADLAAAVLGLAPAPGAEPEVLGADKVKAIFFMLAPGEAPPTAEGKRVRVTFKDGRQVAGFSPDYQEGGMGFFMIPADTRTNTGRIWIYRAAVKQVQVS